MMSNIAFLDKAIFYMLTCYALFSCISIAGTSIALSLAVILAVIRLVKQPEKPDMDRGLVQALLFFFLTLLISALAAYDSATGFAQVWKYFYRMVPLFLVVLFIKKPQQMVVVLLALSVSIFIAGSYTIWQGIHGQQRAAAFGANAMILAGYLVQMIPLLFVMVTAKGYLEKRKRMLLAIVLLISLLALVFNATRGAWVAVAVSLLLYGLMNIKKHKYILPSIVIVCLGVGIVIGATPALEKRVASITDLTERSNAERLLLWQSGWNMFKDHPLTGVGPDNFETLYQGKYVLPAAKQPELSHAHNNFVHMAAETGILGLTGFVYMFGYILYISWHRYRLSPANIWAAGCFFVTVGLLMQGLTEFNFGNSAVTRLYWFIVGLMLVSGSIYNNRENRRL
ncbi:O-antigen ligase family protein [Sporomusa sphaeroides]|uniref:O-Antigen ligase n=1 Tax=Sporomusa sphaeroides DSM 2875 TaxID=1337886 RepID=A0ABM9W491_9FIRM|nr:O-antigen ligase family protein [Sporomusa sphaeroides]OLS55519.1 O-antigen ligase [Sporomusa sphaeroides DSM 2875]CVK19944.1 O-Antigen ligase [Sporomusa sphaeroides DSM 2875]